LKRRVIAGALAAVLLILGILAVVLSRQRLRRRRYFRAAPIERAKAPTAALAQVQQWSDQFRALETMGRWKELAELLDGIAKTNPDLYGRYQLAYLHARALIENDQSRAAMQKLATFLANGNRFRDLALFHRAEIDEARNEHEAASRDRQMLVFQYPEGLYRDQAIDDETEYLTRLGDPQALSAFASWLYPTASTERRRDLDAHLVELLAARGHPDALTRGMALLRGGTLDDPAERVSRALDRPELIRRMTADQLPMLGDALQNHRHFDRAEAVLSMAFRARPSAELQFAIGRSYFGDEKYAMALRSYMAGASSARDPKWKATFLYHASRAAQLLGDDANGEKLITAAIAVPGRFPATTAAITQRIRTRLKQRRFAAAAGYLAFL